MAIINDVLLCLPFLVFTRNDKGKLNFSISAIDLMRTVVTPLLIGAVGVFVTVQVMKKDIEFHTTQLSRIETQVNRVCAEVSTIAQNQAVIKAKQDDRIERERIEKMKR